MCYPKEILLYHFSDFNSLCMARMEKLKTHEIRFGAFMKEREKGACLKKNVLKPKLEIPKVFFQNPAVYIYLIISSFLKVNRPYLAQKNDFPKSLFFPPLKTKFYIFEHKYMCT